LMSLHMFTQIPRVRKFTVTFLTFMRFLSCVRQHMLT